VTALCQATHYTYDAMGHQVTQTLPVNQTLTALSARAWTYDAGGRLTSVCDLGRRGQVKRGSTVLTDNTWNASGTLASRIDGTLGTSFFGYDFANRQTSMTSPVPSIRAAAVVEASVTLNYTTVLNLVFLMIAAVLVIWFLRTGGPEMLTMMDMSAEEMQMDMGASGLN
jgi:hypothetical protein